MKINLLAKKAVCLALLTGASVGANAAPKDLGVIAVGVPRTFSSQVAGDTFVNTFIFTLPANGGSGYNLIDIPIDLEGIGSFKTVFSSMALTYAGANGVVGGGDDVFIKGTFAGSFSDLSLQITPSDLKFPIAAAGGRFYLDVFGRGEGSLGGIYSGSISVSAPPVPEPESYAMFLAGLGLMGVIARRRLRRQS